MTQNGAQATISQVAGQLSAQKTLSQALPAQPDRTFKAVRIDTGSHTPAPPEELARYPTLAQLRRLAASGPCACGGHQVFVWDVPVNHPAHGVPVKCSCLLRQQARRLDALFPTAGIPPRFAEMTFESFANIPARFRQGKGGMVALARRFADLDGYQRAGGIAFTNPAGIEEVRSGALFFGPVGCGKTAMAAIIAKAWRAGGMSLLWTPYLDFVKAVQAGYSTGLAERRLQAAQDVDLLVLDDLGRDRPGLTETTDRIEILDRVITHRHLHDKATLITSNLTPDGIAEQFEARITSRIVYEMGHAMPVKGLDMRAAGKV